MVTTMNDAKMQNFWNQLAKTGDWPSLYEKKFDLRTYNFFTRRNATLELLENESGFQRILDVGCGSGDYSILGEKYKCEYHGIDYATSMVVEGAKRHKKISGKNYFAAGSGESLPYKNELFDLVIGLGYIEYFSDPNITLKEIRRLTKPGSVVIMQSYKKDLFTEMDTFIIKPVMRMLGFHVPEPKMPSTWVNKCYSKGHLDNLMSNNGFKLVDYRYNNFLVAPWPIRKKFPNKYFTTSEKLSVACPQKLGFLATNYIGKYLVE